MTYLLIGLLIASPWLLWMLYACVMRLKQVRDEGKLTFAMKVFGYPALFVGLAVDFVVNVVFGTLVFMQLPREFTLSTRLWRLSTGPTSWRQRWALWIRTNLLDAVDPSGVHRG
jgi:hypothetical protein